MKLHIVAVGERVPSWVDQACTDYQRRFPPHCPLHIETVHRPHRGKRPDIPRLKDKEYRSLSARTPKGALKIVLDAAGRACTTEELARWLDTWLHSQRDVVFMIGGPDGLAPAALEDANQRVSLSALTLPHTLVRIIVVEQLYRALTILAEHPYHRGH